MGCSSTRERHDQAIEAAQERDMQQRMGWGGKPTPSRQRAIQERIRQLDDISPKQGVKVLQPEQQSAFVEVDVDIQETSLENCLEPQPESPNLNPLFTLRHRPDELLPGISSDVEFQSQCSFD